MSKKKKANPEFVPKEIEDSHGEDFFAFIPHQIEADWDEKWGPLLEGLPLNILYGGITKDGQTGKKSVAEVCYWPDLATFHEDSEHKEMWYFRKPNNGYWIRVVFEKKTGRWQTEKFKGDKLVRSAFGSTFDGAMIHTTMGGPEPDERRTGTCLANEKQRFPLATKPTEADFVGFVAYVQAPLRKIQQRHKPAESMRL